MSRDSTAVTIDTLLSTIRNADLRPVLGELPGALAMAGIVSAGVLVAFCCILWLAVWILRRTEGDAP